MAKRQISGGFWRGVLVAAVWLLGAGHSARAETTTPPPRIDDAAIAAFVADFHGHFSAGRNRDLYAMIDAETLVRVGATDFAEFDAGVQKQRERLGRVLQSRLLVAHQSEVPSKDTGWLTEAQFETTHEHYAGLETFFLRRQGDALALVYYGPVDKNQPRLVRDWQPMRRFVQTLYDRVDAGDYDALYDMFPADAGLNKQEVLDVLRKRYANQPGAMLRFALTGVYEREPRQFVVRLHTTYQRGKAEETVALQQAADGTLTLRDHMNVSELVKLLGEAGQGGE